MCLSFWGDIAAISKEYGTVGYRMPLFNVVLRSLSMSPNTDEHRFWPSRWSRRKSPTWNVTHLYLLATNFKYKWWQWGLEADTHYQNHAIDCDGDIHTSALGYVTEIPILLSTSPSWAECTGRWKTLRSLKTSCTNSTNDSVNIPEDLIP
jgi:hypothetical protein